MGRTFSPSIALSMFATAVLVGSAAGQSASTLHESSAEPLIANPLSTELFDRGRSPWQRVGAHSDFASAAVSDSKIEESGQNSLPTLLPSQYEEQFPSIPMEGELGGFDAAAEYGPVIEPQMASDYGEGEPFHWVFWGWLTYLREFQTDVGTFWAWEAELDLNKTITEKIAATWELDFVDRNGGPFVNIEQLFLSFLVPCTEETIFTAGKFNAPFGVEPRDFWDRTAEERSLLFFAQPQDLVGLMLTHPVCCKRIILRPMVVNGWDNNLDFNDQPSIALMAEWRPNKDFSFAVTTWWGPEAVANVSQKLYFVDAQAIWFVCPKISLSGEAVYGNTESPSGRQDWYGILGLADCHPNEHWHAFLQWSLRDDFDGYFDVVPEIRQTIDVGYGWYIHRRVEFRAGYRHEFNSRRIDVDHVQAHLTFGF